MKPLASREVSNKLEALRQSRGLSASALAAAAGVSRQTIYAIESGSYVPNTAISLLLARILGVGVEDLFSLTPQSAGSGGHTEQVALLPGGALPAFSGQQVQLCRINERLIASAPSPFPWCLPSGDAIMTGRSRAQMFDADADYSARILIAGCDPAISVLARHAESAGVQLILAQRNSTQALSLLKSGSVHIAGTHLTDNVPEVSRLFPKDSVALFSFALWEEGILTVAGNPKGIRGVEDFARTDIGIVNREKGAGSRILLDTRLKKLRIASTRVSGYANLVSGHLAAALQVQAGTADCGIATRAAARTFGLHFIPLVTERYDFAIRRKHLDLPSVQTLLNTLHRAGFRRELESMGGYDTSASGQRMM